MNRPRILLLVARITVFLVVVAALAVLTSKVSDLSGKLQTQQDRFAITQKASTETRVTTVRSRCELTQLILGVLVRVHDPQDAAPFQASYRTCRVQLARVKAIDAHTPEPSSRPRR